jgi:hypothetical protein
MYDIVLLCVDCVLASPRIAQADPGWRTPPWGGSVTHKLNSMCFWDKTLWTAQCPLIFYYIVEYHLPSRVIRQFRLEQHVCPPCSSTSVELHRYIHNCMIYMYYPSYLIYVKCNFAGSIMSINEVWRILTTTIDKTLTSGTSTSKTLWGSFTCTLTRPLEHTLDGTIGPLVSS